MDETRFDALTKSLTAALTRRGLARLLGGLAVASPVALLGPSEAEGKKKRKKKKKKKPTCTEAAFLGCTKPAQQAFAAALERCAPECADRDAERCRDCLEPDLESAVAASAACQAKLCQGGPAAEEEDGAATAFGAEAVGAESAGCDSAQLKECGRRSDTDFIVCMLHVESATGIRQCFVTGFIAGSRCKADHGCKSGFCTRNTCCPRHTDRGCSGICCDSTKCQECVVGICRGCQAPAKCGKAPWGWRCECPFSTPFHCGKTCCDLNETCCAGECCAPGEQCVDGECVKDKCGDWTPCGQTCCAPDQQCCDGKACKDKIDWLGRAVKCCSNGTGASCRANHVCCVDPSNIPFCCEGHEACNGYFCKTA